jgi:Peptidoglycan-binding protein, CsiV
MPNLPLQHLTALALCACLPLFANAQEERWYQVELLIFSHQDSPGSEQWEPLPELDYPGAARFLVFPGQAEARLKEQQAVARALTKAASGEKPEVEFQVESETDEFGRQFIRVFPEIIEDTPDIPTPGTAPADEPPLTEQQQAELLPLLPTPFIALPRSSREFHGKAAYMQRTGYYRTLFHETWIQPVLDEKRALPLVIDRSGDQQSWPLLQGSVKLHLSRYLHIETSLWLNTQGEYLPGEWRMPPPPLGPVSVIVEAPEPEPEPEEEPYYPAPVPADPLTGELPGEQELLEPEGPVYPWRHAVLLKQKRKMRSNEVHYIDHPLLGVVIKLTPLDEEQLQILGEAEHSDPDSASPGG